MCRVLAMVTLIVCILCLKKSPMISTVPLKISTIPFGDTHMQEQTCLDASYSIRHACKKLQCCMHIGLNTYNCGDRILERSTCCPVILVSSKLLLIVPPENLSIRNKTLGCVILTYTCMRSTFWKAYALLNRYISPCMSEQAQLALRLENEPIIKQLRRCHENTNNSARPVRYPASDTIAPRGTHNISLTHTYVHASDLHTQKHKQTSMHLLI